MQGISNSQHTSTRRIGRPEQWEPLRQCLGHARRLAERLDLAAMTPQADLASTKYRLAAPLRQYLVYLPDGGQVEVDLSAASSPLTVEWIHPIQGTSQPSGEVPGGGKRVLKAPFNGPAVVHLGPPQPR